MVVVGCRRDARLDATGAHHGWLSSEEDMQDDNIPCTQDNKIPYFFRKSKSLPTCGIIIMPVYYIRAHHSHRHLQSNPFIARAGECSDAFIPGTRKYSEGCLSYLVHVYANRGWPIAWWLWRILLMVRILLQ